MTEYKYISNEHIMDLIKCFSSHEELFEFTQMIELVCKEVIFDSECRTRAEGKEHKAALILKGMAQFIIFCRDNFDLIQQLVGKCVTVDLTEEKMKELKDEQ